jgi:ribonucleoside-diphosphate reductase alpha chain
MKAYLEGAKWSTKPAHQRQGLETFEARDLMRQIAKPAWNCADPGVQFDTTINDWHTSSNTDRIHASNPCSEYMF